MSPALCRRGRTLWWLFGACPAGFRTAALLGTVLVLLGLGQLIGLPWRSAAYPGWAVVFALVLLSGGLVLRGLVALNLWLAHVPDSLRSAAPSASNTASAPWTRRALSWARRRLPGAAQPAPLLAGLAGVLLLGALLRVASEGQGAPLQVLLLWRPARWAVPAAAPGELVAPLLTLFEGSLLLSLAAVAVCVLVGASWVGLQALQGPRWLREGAEAALRGTLGLFGRLPYLVPALLARLWLCRDVSLRAAEVSVSYKPSFSESFFSFQGVEPGLLVAGVFLGLQAGDGLLKWLQGVREGERRTDSHRLGRVLGRPLWRALLRDGVWLRRRQELSGLLLSAAAWALLLDMLSSGLIDAFGQGTFPLYPSLGSLSFVGLSTGAGPSAALAAGRLSADGLHVLAVGAACLLLLAAGLPLARALPRVVGGALRVAGRTVVAADVPPLNVLATTRDHALLWVLGTSGSGKTSLLRAWHAQTPGCVLVPQDPDLALPGGASLDEVLRAGLTGSESRSELVELLEHLSDERLALRLDDPFLPARWLSRGERQRLGFALGLLAAARRGQALLLDEFSSGQDRNRTARMVAALRRRVPQGPASTVGPQGVGQLVIASHDPEVLDALTNWASQAQSLQGGDEVVWLSPPAARRHLASRRPPGQGPRLSWEPSGRPGAGTQPSSDPAVEQFLECLESMLAARDEAARDRGAGEPPSGRSGAEQVPVAAADEALPPPRRRAAPRTLLPSGLRLAAGPWHLELQAAAVVHRSGLHLLEGPSGSGKSTLLWHLAEFPPAACPVGLVPQDPGRALPGQTVVFEALRPALPRALGLRGTAAAAQHRRQAVAELRAAVRRGFGSGFEDELWAWPVQDLSEGMRQRLLFVREPLRLGTLPAPHGQRLELLLLDEPFGSVDPVNHRDMLASVLGWLSEAEHRAAVLVSHRPEYDMLQARRHNAGLSAGHRQRPVEIIRWMLSVANEASP